MSKFLTHNQKMCFRNTFDCLCERAPVLLWGTLGTLYIFLTSSMFRVVSGSMELTTEQGTVKAGFIAETVVYSILVTFILVIAWLLYIASFAIADEIRKLPATIKECIKCKDEDE